MAINEYVYNEQEEVKQFYELMYRLDEGTREKKIREEHKKAREEHRKWNRECRKREKAEYLVSCMREGYNYPLTEEMANQKYPDETLQFDVAKKG